MDLKIVDRINELSDRHALEALKLLGGEELPPATAEELLSEAAAASGHEVDQVAKALRQTSGQEMAAFARVALLAYAASDQAAVEEAIAESGQVAVVLEILLVGAIALSLTNLLLTEGKKSETREMTISVHPDGKIDVRVQDRIEYYSVGESLAPLVGEALGQLMGGA
jgi:hypothetical protein